MQVTEVLIIALTKKEIREELYCYFYITNDMNFFKKKKKLSTVPLPPVPWPPGLLYR